MKMRKNNHKIVALLFENYLVKMSGHAINTDALMNVAVELCCDYPEVNDVVDEFVHHVFDVESSTETHDSVVQGLCGRRER